MVRLLDRPVMRWTLPWLWMGMIFWFSAQSTLPNLTPGAPDLQSIAGHLCVYAVLAWLWWRALRCAGVRHAAAWAMLLAVLYGVSDEYHQSFVPHRDPSLGDLSLDAIGAAASLLAATTMQRLSSHARARSGAKPAS